MDLTPWAGQVVQPRAHLAEVIAGTLDRRIGALIMAHGDDKGLILPPRLAPSQVVIVPIFRNDEPEAQSSVLEAVEQLATGLDAVGVRAKVDRREGLSPGWKFNDWERKGVPLRIELGPRDLASGHVVVADRLSGEKTSVPLDRADLYLVEALQGFHDRLLDRAAQFMRERTSVVGDYEAFRQAVENGWAYADHCGLPACEAKIQEDTKATPRCIPFEGPSADGPCVRCGAPSGYPRKVIFARAY